MKPFPCVSRLLLASALPMLAVPVSQVAAAQRKAAVRPAAARPAVPKPAAADNSIIPLPLNPVVPAGQRQCAARTPNGLGYTVLRAGAGAMPAADSTVLVNYVGYLAATGAVFDQGMQAAFPVGGVIPGFAQGLQMVAKSGVVRLCIPAALGYGAQGTGPIPANADLVFQVELLDFKSAAEIEELRKAETAAPAAAEKEPAPQP